MLFHVMQATLRHGLIGAAMLGVVVEVGTNSTLLQMVSLHDLFHLSLTFFMFSLFDSVSCVSDDNGNINDGTPHMKAIYAAFNEQEIACGSPSVMDSGCNNGPNSAPQVSINPGNMAATLTWTAVSGASNYQVFRTEGVKSCGQGKVKLTTTTSRSFTGQYFIL